MLLLNDLLDKRVITKDSAYERVVTNEYARETRTDSSSWCLRSVLGIRVSNSRSAGVLGITKCE